MTSQLIGGSGRTVFDASGPTEMRQLDVDFRHA